VEEGEHRGPGDPDVVFLVPDPVDLFEGIGFVAVRIDWRVCVASVVWVGMGSRRDCGRG
jgi:hypothetical protein